MISGLRIDYRVNNEADEFALQRMMVALERGGTDLSDFARFVFPKMVPIFEAEVARQFAAEGQGPNRGSWAELSPAYGEWKEAHYPGKPILELTGKLREALTSSSADGALRDYDESSFNYGTQGIEYASRHQSGTGRMPDRPPFDFGAEFERGVLEAATEGAREAIVASGLDEFFEEDGG